MEVLLKTGLTKKYRQTNSLSKQCHVNFLLLQSHKAFEVQTKVTWNAGHSGTRDGNATIGEPGTMGLIIIFKYSENYAKLKSQMLRKKDKDKPVRKREKKKDKGTGRQDK